MLTASLVPNSNVPLIGENGHLRSRSTSQHFQGDRTGISCRGPGISASSVDTISDSLSLATTATEGTIGEVWERKQYSAMPLGCAVIRNRPPSFLNLSSRGQEQSSEKDLYEFLRDAELEHYYSVLTRHLKIRSVQQIKYVEDSDLAELGFSRPEQRRLRKHFKRECPQTAMGKLRKRLARSTSGRCSSLRFKDTLDGLSSRNLNVLSISLDSTPTSEDGDSKRRTLLFTQGSKSDDLSKCLEDDLGNLTVDGNKNYRVIRSSELEIGSSLGEGEFGKVFQGVWHTDSRRVVQVAIKIVDTKKMGDETCDFLNEIAMMHRLDHPDIVRLLGVCVEINTIKIVTELAPLRSLLECLRESELRSSFSVPILHKFSLQIARGMSYLEECGLVHRDLAARNVLVFSKDVVKISDFGMSRALQLGKSYYQSNFNVNLKLPIAWCAPECIHDLLFTTASDMWAYGITLWEIFTYGFTPWAGLAGRQVLEMIDAPRFRRLDQPDACPDPIYDAVMRACWAHEPKARPTFAQLLGMLPRLSPEVWVTASEYRPDSDLNVDTISTTEEFPYNPGFRPHGTRSLGRPLFIRANETVCVLGKRSSTTWKVVNLRTGLVGCIPCSILKPYTGANDSSSRDQTLITSHNNSTNNGSGNASGNSNNMGLVARTRLRMSRRASLTDLAIRKTVSRLNKLGTIIPTDSVNSNSSIISGSAIRSRGKITADQISLPQNDFRHIGHVGSDGRTFGELGLVGKIIDSKDNLFDSQSFSELDMSEEKHKGNKSNNKANTLQVNPNNSNKNHSEVTKPIPLATASPPVTVLNSQQQLKTKGLESATKLLTSNKNQPKRLQNEKTSIDIQQQHQHQNNNDNDETDKLFEDIKFNVISESNGFDLGSSLLDEVFKCFQMEKSIEKTNNTGNVEENEFDSNTKKETDRIYSINNNQHSDVLNGVGNDDMLNLNSTVINKLSSTDDLTTEYPVGTFNATPDPIKMGRNAWKPVDVSRQFRASSSSSTPRRILTNGSITPHSNDYLSTYITSNNKNNSHILDSPSHQSIFTNTLNYEVKENRVSDSNYVENHRVVGNDDDDDDSDVNHLRKLKSTIIKTEHKSSLWKRSSFGSLTRRSSSVSKSSNKNNFMGFNQSDHDNNTNKRLTISRPVLLSRPNSITQTSLNQLPSNSSSSSIVGGLTEPSSLGSSTSRGSSLTVVSSANGCSSNSGGGGGGNACSLSVNNGQEELLAPETHSLNTDIHHQPSASSYYEISTNASLSPAPSLSSMMSATCAASHSLASSITNSTNQINNSSVTNYLLPNSNVTSTAQGCLRALRSGETVFRASMNTSSGTLNSRRKMSMSSRVNPTVMADENLANSRIQNLSPSATLINLTAKNANDTSISSSSSSLLKSKSKLLFNRDIYQSSRERSPNHPLSSSSSSPAATNTTINTTTSLQYKDLTRTHLSQHSSSSSSSISPPTTPFPYDSSNGQPGNIHSKLDRTTLITSMAKTNGSNDNRSSMDLDCVMASFLGKDFADFLGGDTNIYEPYSSSSPSKHLSNKSQVGLDSQSNLSRSPFKSSLSRLPRRSNLPNNEEDDVLAI